MMMIQTLRDVEAPGELVSFTGWGEFSEFLHFLYSIVEHVFMLNRIIPPVSGEEHSGGKEVIENKDLTLIYCEP